ncbi:protein translocase subunit SecF [Brachyspira hyodysenteriae]|uniref:protein translocase subunit SecF n=1 Tax=Brachyspira hyodysenteriae TaxID=159 RepID=UPI00063DA7CC|nr:protein translocase subunit SecF [Brachyspira hyodysenteriae]KLI24649.1 preprotein translocase subunit SecF [Brachyspira hyodysenteriae]TVL57883.1 protein-export membrane protein SecF [Brachyspira hyodysenteriae]TVL58260.1 protein-export membrane protein SecF [Brachyspira hyodysenteriae]TVL81648.1 protein-export membrane protein SecF [Brachyspira hyodysenteriae]WPC38969.1 protein translocase subunit SecF [Brachyspira hyodysenteriae]
MSEEIKKENNDLTKNKIPFVKIMPIAAVVSSILFIASIALFVNKLTTNSFNMGIDFAGGVELKVQIDNPEVINIAEIRALYNNFGTETVNIQELEGADNVNAFLLRFRGSNEESDRAMQVLYDKYTQEKVNLIGSNIISGVVSADNLKLAFILIIVSWIIIMIYITIRFNYRYAFPAIITLIHNVVIVFGILLFLNKEFSVLVLSSMLTLIGYTINDIIVVFDRIRENANSKKPFKEIVNISLNNVVGRTIITSISTLLAALAIMIWGGFILYDFAFTFFCGVVIGTYASNFIASGLLILFMKTKKD